MTDVLSIAALGIITAVCAVVVRKQVPELALLLAIGAGAMIMIRCSGALKTLIGFTEELVEKGELTKSIVSPVIKVTGISAVTRLGSDFCRDAREGALATAVETAGSILSLLAVVPLLSATLDLLAGLI